MVTAGKKEISLLFQLSMSEKNTKKINSINFKHLLFAEKDVGIGKVN